MPGKMTNREFYHGTPERDAKTKVRGYVGMNNVRLVTIELLRSVARPSLRARGGLLTARRGSDTLPAPPLSYLIDNICRCEQLPYFHSKG